MAAKVCKLGWGLPLLYSADGLTVLRIDVPLASAIRNGDTGRFSAIGIYAIVSWLVTLAICRDVYLESSRSSWPILLLSSGIWPKWFDFMLELMKVAVSSLSRGL